jgi:D-alanyl-D-alanine carboxypeptidase
MKTIHACSSFVRFASWALLFILFPALTFAQQPLKKQAEQFILEAMKENHIPGLVFAVVKDGQVIHRGHYGLANLAWQAPVDPETAFQTASCSKLFTALLLGRLIDEQILSPEQRLSELLDSIPDTWKSITLRQLASHQSGIKMADFAQHQSTRESLEAAKKESLEFEPGTQSFYVSSDYWILQYIIEKKLNKPYFEALQQFVLQPLGMKHTYVNYNNDRGIRTHQVIPKEATVYAYQQNRYVVSDMQFGPTGYTAGGIYTTIEDFARIAQTLDKGTFLKPATQALLLSPTPLKDGQPGSFGMGPVAMPYQGHSVSGHTGGPALSEFVRFNDEKYTFITLTNQRGFYPYLAQSLATFYINGLKMPEVPKM